MIRRGIIIILIVLVALSLWLGWASSNNRNLAKSYSPWGKLPMIGVGCTGGQVRVLVAQSRSPSDDRPGRSYGLPGKILRIRIVPLGSDVGQIWMTTVSCRYWVLTVLCSAYPLIVLLRYPSRRRKRLWRVQGRCHECGYNLTGNTSGVCSECGTEIKS